MILKVTVSMNNYLWPLQFHYIDVIMRTMAYQITSLTIVYSIAYSGADKKYHQSSASLTFVRGIHLWPVSSPHKRASDAKNVSIWWRHHSSRKAAPLFIFRVSFYALRPEQNGRHFADSIPSAFSWIKWAHCCQYFTEVCQKGLDDSNSELVKVIVWYWKGNNPRPERIIS